MNFLRETLSAVPEELLHDIDSAVPEGRLFDLDMQTLFSIGILLFNVCLLAVALTFILYKPVREFMAKRTEKIRAQLSNAADSMFKANELKAEYEQKLKDIEKERTEILESAHKFAAEKTKQLMDDARNEAASVRERSKADVQRERELLKEEVRSSIIEISSVMAEKFMTRSIDEETQNKLFNETIAELEETSWLS